MSIHAWVTAALVAVVDNTWAGELPPKPVWPALVFNIQTKPESGWVLGGGYELNAIEVMIYARSRSEINALQSLVLAAMETAPGYMGDEEHGDAAYEDDPQVFAYAMNFLIRTRIGT